MPRLSREESQERTRAKLLAAARTLFARNGYGMTSVDRIAEKAGFSKGAVYSNFQGKEDLFLEVLHEQGETTLERLLTSLADTNGDTEAVIGVIAEWSESTAKSGNWPMLVLEHAQHTQNRKHDTEPQEALFRNYWIKLGDRICSALGINEQSPELVGALVFELTYAPAMRLVTQPTAGDLVRFALTRMVISSEKPARYPSSCRTPPLPTR